MLHVHCVHRLRLLLLWGSLLFGVVISSPTPRKLFGEITSPNHPKPYPNNNISTWDITVPKGFVVKLNFWQFDLEPSESCLYDYVKVAQSFLNSKQDLGRYCGQLGSATGNHPGVKEFVSKGNRMRVMFHSDFSNEENGTLIPYKGFLAYYQAVGEYESSTCRRGALGPIPNRQRPQDSSQTRSTISTELSVRFNIFFSLPRTPSPLRSGRVCPWQCP
uniref:Complement C1r n=1 Tax=Chelonoidis abingdonii TaxID=106734 RepID=A0A8C0G0F0_CHEAB